MLKTLSAALLVAAMAAAPALAASSKAKATAKPAVSVTTPMAKVTKPVVVKPAVKKVRHARAHRLHKMSAHRHVQAKASIKAAPKPAIKKKV